MDNILVIADDLTGALDSAGRLSVSYRPIPVITNLADTIFTAPISVFNLETRNEKRDIVNKRVFDVVKESKCWGVKFLYIKIDSTLRGHISSTIQSAKNSWSQKSVLFCPSFPAQYRTVVNGQLFVSGIPVESTPFANDPRHPIHSSLLKDCFLDLCDPIYFLSLDKIRLGCMVVTRILKSKPGIWIADGETEEDIEVLVSGAVRAGLNIFVGSAGLIEFLPPVIGVECNNQYNEPMLGDGKILFVIGSQHPIAKEQVQTLCASHSSDISIISTFDIPYCFGMEDKIIIHLAKEVETYCKLKKVNAIIVVGGETASAVTDVAGIKKMLVWGEVVPGVPWAQINDGLLKGSIWISKAGGFGDQNMLVQIIEWLQASWNNKEC
jgi:uncharacterized protein YgbK (DUF1537 family)